MSLAAQNAILSSGQIERRRRDWLDAAILTTFLWSTIVILYLPVLLARHPQEGLGSAVIEGATVLLSILFGMILFGLDRLVAPRGLACRVAVLVSGILVLAAAQTLLDAAFTYWIALTFKPHWSTAWPTLSQSYSPFFTYVCFFAFNVALFQMVFWRRRAALHRWQLAEALLVAKQAELTALRFQLNPHFLFNSLNAISSLIVTERYAQAEVMTDRLAEFLRNALISDPTARVTLEAELAVVNNYLEVERVRFGERLQLQIDTDDAAARVRVPSFILQPLVENAIKYGVAPSATPALVLIEARLAGNVLHIRVVNDVPARVGQRPSGTGVGLVNVRERLRAEYGEDAALDVTPGEQRFEVALRLPAR